MGNRKKVIPVHLYRVAPYRLALAWLIRRKPLEVIFMKENLPNRMLQLMSDGYWHPTEELVEKISHRFSATIYVLRKRGYIFEDRRIEGQRREWRLVVESQVTA